MNYIIHRSDSYLQHFGIRGQKWGVRRFQNEDGSYKSGAEGRYAQPVKGTISGPKYNASSSGPFSYVGSGAGKRSVGVKVSDKYGKISGGGGGSKASETEEETNEKIDRKNIHIYDVSEKLPEKGSKTAKGGSGKGSSSSEKKDSEKKEQTGKAAKEKTEKEQTEKTEKEEKKPSFKPDDLYSKIDGLELDSLSDTDQKELDDLISEWRTYRSTHTASNKKSREIDEFIQQYERWKSDKKNRSDFSVKKLKPGIEGFNDRVHNDSTVKKLKPGIEGFNDRVHNESSSKGLKPGIEGFNDRVYKKRKITMKKLTHSDNMENDYELYHFGVRGMKWGIRRYQNEDGSYKSGAEGRYNSDGKTVKNRIKAKLGIYKDGDGNPYVSEKRREDRRRQQEEQQKQKDAESTKKAQKDVEKGKWYKSYNKATDEFNKKIEDLNKRYEGKGVENKAYVKAVNKLWNELYTDEIKRTYGNVDQSTIESFPAYNMYLEYLKK